MFTNDDLLLMNDQELKELIFKINQYKNIISRKPQKIHIEDNDENNVIIKKLLAEFLYPRLVNKELVKSFEISDNRKYYKNLEISKNLVFDNTNYSYLFESLIWTPNGIKSIYDGLIWFLKEQKYNFSDNIDEKINNFVEDKNNNCLVFKKKSEYHSLNEEIQNLNKVNNNIIPKELDEYVRICRFMGINDPLNNYRNKKIGNIGEIITYKDFVKNKYNPFFVSKECGDGYGYDIFSSLYSDNLIEVKSTLNNSLDDSFTLSENEYNVMLDTLNLDNTNYYICRVFLTLKGYNDLYHSIDILKPIDDKTLISLNKDSTYTLNNTDKKIFTKKYPTIRL